jgi:hypothetical protein
MPNSWIADRCGVCFATTGIRDCGMSMCFKMSGKVPTPMEPKLIMIIFPENSADMAK